MKQDEFLFLSEQDVEQLLRPEDVITAVEQTFRSVHAGRAVYGQVGRLDIDVQKRNFFMTFPTALPDLGVAGVKWFSGFTEGLPGWPFSHGNFLILSDTQTGSPLALMGAGRITAMRTAGGHAAVAAAALSGPAPKTLAVLGAGAQALHGIAGFCTLFPSLEEIRVYTRSPERVATLQRAAGEVPVIPCPTPRQAVEGAELILAATTSKETVLRAEDVDPGATVLAISAFSDVDPALSERADKWILGNEQEDGRNIFDSSVMRQGVTLARERVYGVLPEILCGEKPGREKKDEIILYTHMGMGFFDIACGAAVYRRAREQEIGTSLVLDRFP